MTPVLTSCVTMTPPSDSADTDTSHNLGQGSAWSGIWSISKSVAKSFHPDFDPGQRSDQPGGPWIQLKIQPKELALRLAQRAIPANSYFNTINQVAMACLALASLPGCGGETSQDHNPGTSKEPTGTPASTSPSTSPETNGTDLRVKALSYVDFKAPGDWNHKAHKEHKGKEKLFLVLFVCFVVPIQISKPVSIPMFAGFLSLSQCHWNINRVEPGSLIHNAIGYALNQWPKLIIYCEDGLLNISNAAAENAIRPLTVGRRNWLFADTPDGTRASAIYCSLIESAKANGLEPFEYICYVLEELPYADTVEKLEALLPWNVKASGALSRNTSHSQTA
ncbi:transposase [Salinisphaera sp. G21_0]|uniref:IS66 family transposase n=1 Tax=Salinisphaera sp. G21_0 TaxID=2821094 RepID=UPI001ADB82F4|nr:transposase [Salinisphaera sp. G21_0]MBO9482874.1 transposase [Salinisphaera sp. G21_0]